MAIVPVHIAVSRAHPAHAHFNPAPGFIERTHLLAAHKLRPPAREGVGAGKGQLKSAPHQEAAKDAPAHVPDLHDTRFVYLCSTSNDLMQYLEQDCFKLSVGW